MAGGFEPIVYAFGCLVLETNFGCFYIHNKHSFFQVVEQLFTALARQLCVQVLETDPANYEVDRHVAIDYSQCLYEALGSYLRCRQLILVQVDAKKNDVHHRDYQDQYWNNGRVGHH